MRTLPHGFAGNNRCTFLLFHLLCAVNDFLFAGLILACGDNEYGQCCVYSAEKHVSTFQHVTAIDGGPHAERTKTLVCGRDWTAGMFSFFRVCFLFCLTHPLQPSCSARMKYIFSAGQFTERTQACAKNQWPLSKLQVM